MSKRVPTSRTNRARQLRREATPAERKFWSLISRVRPKFTRQFPIGPYIVDFACRQVRLAVEIDGGQHAENAEDARRDAYLRSEGWQVLRFWNPDILNNPEGVYEVVNAEAAKCLGGTHPQPLPSKEGRQRRPRFR